MVYTAPAGLLSVLLVVLQGCTMTPATTHNALAEKAPGIPAADPVLDHYIAWVPLQQAQTAGIARAMTHITLVNARQQVTAELCGDTPVIKQPATDHVGPFRTRAPRTVGAYPAWYYRISQPPGLHGCTATDKKRFQAAVASRLPAWINIQTATNQAE